MIGRIHVTLIVGVTVAVWAIVLAVRGTAITWDHFVPFGTAVTALTLMLHAFNSTCWRWGIFKGWLVQRPNLNGTWKVIIENEVVGRISGYMVFRQTFTSLTARLYTQESASASVTTAILQSPDCVFQVASTYQNEPRPDLRGVRSEIHFGAFLLDVHGDPPARLTGKYWTDRKTGGSVTLSDRKAKLVTSFDEGAATLGP